MRAVFRVEEEPLGVSVMILGPAGSGKSLLAARFSEYLRDEGYSVEVVNLDPGALTLPYKPFFDVRDRFTVREIMEREGLGPNGAMIRAMDLLASTSIPNPRGDYIIYDTPGQLEPFLFHRAGRRIASKIGDPCAVYLVDASLPTWSLPGIYLYFIVAQMNLGIPAIAAVSRGDMVSKRKVERIVEALSTPRLLKRYLGRGLIADLGGELVKVIEDFLPPQRIPVTSAVTGEGFDELLALLHEFKCTCGDLT